jgi:uncharacterized tellurite resistance protein B-like protein
VSNSSKAHQFQGFDDVQNVLANEERFKAKLGMGRDVFGTLKAGDMIAQLTQMATAAGSGAGIAAVLAAPSSLWGTLLVATGFANPIGWIAGAAAASGSMCYGVSRLYRLYSSSRVDEVPKFLNTGLDILASSTLDLLGSLAMKVATIDGNVDQSERDTMHEYFVDEWGYDPIYVEHALDLLEHNVEKNRLHDMTSSLAEFAKNNPDCNFTALQTELMNLLCEIMEADGHIDEREEMAIERITASLRKQNSLINSIKTSASVTASGVEAASKFLEQSTNKAASEITSAFQKFKGQPKP